MGFIDGQGLVTTRRAFWLSTVFASGIGAIAIIGVITAGLGRLIGDVGPWNYFVAVVFFVVGLHLMDVIRLTLRCLPVGSERACLPR